MSLQQNNLFSPPASTEPLASRMRPKTLEAFLGQEHLTAQGRMLRRAIEADMLGCTILYGPPGTGKTSLARLIAKTTKSHFIEINATESSIAELREMIQASRRRLDTGQSTTCFIDEIHRFNRGQQDALLPHVEKGTVRLIGATTQNPFFALNAPLISRAQIFQFHSLKPKEIKDLLQRALKSELDQAQAEEDALELLIQRCDGDARRALNGLELAWKTCRGSSLDGKKLITFEDAQESIQTKAILYDHDGDGHYDTISAFIKSMRGSDPDATLYWLAKMLEAGEEPRYIARRIVIHAAEDVGLADPQCLATATAAQSAVETIGMPEAKIPLAMAALHVALAPKSNAACKGISQALAYVQNQELLEIPTHLRDTHYEGASKLGNGDGYLYPHNFPNGFVQQEYLPKELKFYHPSENGRERELCSRLELLKNLHRKNKEIQ